MAVIALSKNTNTRSIVNKSYTNRIIKSAYYRKCPFKLRASDERNTMVLSIEADDAVPISIRTPHVFSLYMAATSPTFARRYHAYRRKINYGE